MGGGTDAWATLVAGPIGCCCRLGSTGYWGSLLAATAGTATVARGWRVSLCCGTTATVAGTGEDGGPAGVGTGRGLVAGFQGHLPGGAEGQQHGLLQQGLAALHHVQPAAPAGGKG